MNSLQELKFRNFIQGAIKTYMHSMNNKAIIEIIEENEVRKNIRKLIMESALEDRLIIEVEEPDSDVHDNTGINTLKDLLKNTNILATLRSTYKTLTTGEEQRRSFRAHIIKWIQDTLAPVTINDAAPEPPNIAEAIDVDVTPEDEDKYIEAEDGSPAKEDEEEEPTDPEENPLDPIEDEDTTGRNKAERVYPKIETSVVDYYGELDNDEDMELFHDYLIANTKLYFDKWENEMTPSIEEPTNDAYDAQGTEGGAGEVEAPELGEEEPLDVAAEE